MIKRPRVQKREEIGRKNGAQKQTKVRRPCRRRASHAVGNPRKRKKKRNEGADGGGDPSREGQIRVVPRAGRNLAA